MQLVSQDQREKNKSYRSDPVKMEAKVIYTQQSKDRYHRQTVRVNNTNKIKKKNLYINKNGGKSI